MNTQDPHTNWGASPFTSDGNLRTGGNIDYSVLRIENRLHETLATLSEHAVMFFDAGTGQTWERYPKSKKVRKAIKRLRAIHIPHSGTFDVFCDDCRENWPCDVIVAIGEGL